MHFLTTVLVLSSALFDLTSAHPSKLHSRGQTKNVPIDELLQGSKVVASGKGDGKVLSVSMPAKSKNKGSSKRSPAWFEPPPGPRQPCLVDPLEGDRDNWVQTYRWITKEWSQHMGIPRAISEVTCPPSSVTDSRAVSYTYSVNVQLGPDLKFGPAILDKFGIRVGFQMSWGTTTTVGYTASCSDGDDFPCVAMFTPSIGVITGTGWIEWIGIDGTTVCDKSGVSDMQINVPIIGDSNVCQGGDAKNPCGPAGAYDHCYITGQPRASQLCPGSGLNEKTPPKLRGCPPSVVDGAAG